jgi:hypothetical protein
MRSRHGKICVGREPVATNSGRVPDREKGQDMPEPGGHRTVGETGAVWDMGLHGTSQF